MRAQGAQPWWTLVLAMTAMKTMEGHWLALDPMTWTEPIEMITAGHQGINSTSPPLNLSSKLHPRRLGVQDRALSSLHPGHQHYDLPGGLCGALRHVRAGEAGAGMKVRHL